MVVLNRIYTRAGDKGDTALGTGRRIAKSHLRIQSYGTVDELNSVVGIARLHCADLDPLDTILAGTQNELFDLGADLCVPESDGNPGYTPLRITDDQVKRLETAIDKLNDGLPTLRSFVLPGGHPAAAYLHLARTVCRRAERLIVELAGCEGESVNPEAIAYVNRLSDFFFVAARWVNAQSSGDVLWEPGKTR